MDVLLVTPPQIFRPGNIWGKIRGCTPPLGLALLAAILERAGHRVKILDGNAEVLDDDGLLRRLAGIKAGSGSPGWVGITSSTNTFPAAVRVSGFVRKIFPEAKIVFGGVHATVFPEEALAAPTVDFVVRGEGEATFLSLLGDEPPETISGLSFRSTDRVIHTPNRDSYTDLGTLPLPAYHLLPMHLYRPALGSHRRLPAIGIVISRGCPGRCTFCYGHHLGRITRYRPVASVVDEIRLLQKNWGIREVSFYDDTFTARPGYVVELCEAILAGKLDLTWSCFSRVDFVTEELLRLMKRSGCHQICYGIESGNEEILRVIHKRISLAKARQALAWTRSAGIETRTTFMLGNPGETMQTMEQTLRLALELDPDIALFNIATPYPGTEMYAWADEHGYLTTKAWECYDLSRPVMRLPSLNEEELLRFYRDCYRRFYRRGGYLLRRLLRVRTLDDLRVGWKAVRSVVVDS
ncbi:MAG: B12-binding domain-containing radical SAM protein [Candidatus Methylomirabilia bacterium]